MTKQDPAERAAGLTESLRAATQEAAGVLKDLHAAIKSARAKIDEYAHTEMQRELDRVQAQMQRDLDAAWSRAKADLEENAVNRLAELFGQLTEISPEAMDAFATVLRMQEAIENGAVPAGSKVVFAFEGPPHATRRT